MCSYTGKRNNENKNNSNKCSLNKVVEGNVFAFRHLIKAKELDVLLAFATKLILFLFGHLNDGMAKT